EASESRWSEGRAESHRRPSRGERTWCDTVDRSKSDRVQSVGTPNFGSGGPASSNGFPPPASYSRYLGRHYVRHYLPVLCAWLRFDVPYIGSLYSETIDPSGLSPTIFADALEMLLDPSYARWAT